MTDEDLYGGHFPGDPYVVLAGNLLTPTEADVNAPFASLLGSLSAETWIAILHESHIMT